MEITRVAEDSIQDAADDAVAWGFPRDVEDSETGCCQWFRMGDGVVFWFEYYPPFPTVFVHLAVKPEARKRWPVRRWLRWVEEYARGRGATALGFIPCPGSEASEGYLRRLGWREVSYGLEREVA